MKNTLFIGCLFISVFMTSCAVVRQDQIGVRRKFGKISNTILQPGMSSINPFATTIIRLPSRTVNLEVRLDLPSKEGLTIQSEISILYRIVPEEAPKILRQAGINYENVLILPVFRSASADVTARFFAKDMHSSQRAVIEQAIVEQMMKILEPRGFIIESVLMKSVRLPEGLSKAIEEKLQAEQQAQRMEFILNRERQEAERIKIQAEGIRDAQRIISESLSPMIIQFKSIEAFKELTNSPNSKVIITDGRTPLLINTEAKGQ
jgi:regulator of protease activity HflC (stomatin/prohibitin superfamily)